MCISSFFGILAIVFLLSGIPNAQSNPPQRDQTHQGSRTNAHDWESDYRTGEMYFHSGRIADGIPWMKKAVALRPDNYVAGYDLALAYYDIHDYKKARAQIQSTLNVQNTAELHSLLADVEEGAGNYLQAASEYQTAAHLDPTEERVFDWAVELIAHQTYAPAVRILKRGVELYPRSLKMSVGLGMALYFSQQYDQAMKQLCAATELSPSEKWPYLFLGRSYADMSTRFDTDEVRERLKHFASLQPRNPDALYYYAISLRDRDNSSAKERDEAVALLKKAVEIKPAFAAAHLQLGILYANQGEYAGAVDQLRSAVRLDPNLTTTHYRLAQAYRKSGEIALASREFQIFQRLHTQENKSSQERDQVAQFIVDMKDRNSSMK